MHARIIVCCVLILLSLGCLSRAPKSQIANEATPERIRLRAFLEFFETRIERAADQVAQIEEDPEIDRNTVYLKMRAIPFAQNALLLADDQAVALQLWIVSAAMVEAFKGKFGPQFGDSRSIVIEAAKEIEAEAVKLASSLLTPKQMKEAGVVIRDFVKDNVGKTGLEYSPEQSKALGKTASSILGKPLRMLRAPFSSLDPTSGLSDTALAVQNFTDQFTRARTDADNLPRKLRWNLQLLLMEMEETFHLSEMTKGVGEIGASADNIADTAKALPGELRAELSAFAGDLEKYQPDLKATLDEANATLVNTRETAQTIDALGTTLVGTFEAFTKIVESFESDPDDPAPEDPEDEGPPFDINDYGRTAEKLTETAHALTALFDQVDEMASAQEPPPVLADTEATARAIVDRFFVAAAAFVLFSALVAYGYRVAVARRIRS